MEDLQETEKCMTYELQID